MRSGSLKHRLTIWTPSTGSRSARGGDTAAWTQLDQVWGEIRPISAREVEIARGLSPTVSHRIRIRQRSGITTRCRITYGERTFFVNGAISPLEDQRELLVYCTEVTS